MFLVPRWSLAIFLLPHPPDLWWWSIYPSSPTHLFPLLSFPLCPFTFNSVTPVMFLSSFFWPRQSIPIAWLFNHFPPLCSTLHGGPQIPALCTQRCPEGLSHARRLRSQLQPGSKRPRHKSETWGSPGDFWSQDSIQSFTVVSVGLYEAALCKLRAIYTLVIISTEIYLRQFIKRT